MKFLGICISNYVQFQVLWLPRSPYLLYASLGLLINVFNEKLQSELAYNVSFRVLINYRYKIFLFVIMSALDYTLSTPGSTFLSLLAMRGLNPSLCFIISVLPLLVLCVLLTTSTSTTNFKEAQCELFNVPCLSTSLSSFPRAYLDSTLHSATIAAFTVPFHEFS